MTDIEDFIKLKNLAGKNEHNNIDTTKYDLNKCKNIFSNLLLCYKNYDSNKKDNHNLKNYLNHN